MKILPGSFSLNQCTDLCLVQMRDSRSKAFYERIGTAVQTKGPDSGSVRATFQIPVLASRYLPNVFPYLALQCHQEHFPCPKLSQKAGNFFYASISDHLVPCNLYRWGSPT